MRNLLSAGLLLTTLSIAACSSVKLTNTSDAAPAPDKTVASVQDTRDPGIQQSQSAVIGKWKVVFVSGGITGKVDAGEKNEYYTFTADSFIADRNGVIEKAKYSWNKVKDIHSGLPVFQMTGLGWVFTPQDKDTLKADMNAYDGYVYTLARVKQ